MPLTQEELKTYRAIKNLANQEKKSEITKQFSEKQIKMAYRIAGAHFNLTVNQFLPKWVKVIKEVRDEIITNKAICKIISSSIDS